ncbi:MAG: hypothetical protein ACW98F_02720 [Candidatus Hodarchaeales archaeon]|jgi:predicted transcriptional regulator
MLKKEKIDILAYIFSNPQATSDQINNYVVIQRKSRKTTSTIYKYLRELVSDGFLIEFGSIQRKFSITRKGQAILKFNSRHPFQDCKPRATINVIIITTPHYCLDYHDFSDSYPRTKPYGGKF